MRSWDLENRAFRNVENKTKLLDTTYCQWCLFRKFKKCSSCRFTLKEISESILFNSISIKYHVCFRHQNCHWPLPKCFPSNLLSKAFKVLRDGNPPNDSSKMFSLKSLESRYKTSNFLKPMWWRAKSIIYWCSFF